MKNHITTFLFLSTALIGCQNQPKHDLQVDTKPLIDSIDYYQTYKDIAQYLPDTTFDASINTKINIGKKQETLDSILIVREETDTSLYNKVMARNAKLKFNEYANILTYKYLKSKKDGRNIIWLTFYSPYNKTLSIKKYLEIMDSYPVSVQNSEIGLKIKNKLLNYRFNKNEGKQLSALMNQINIYKEISPHQYYILVLGASWCKPCIEEEKALKYWYPKIDTSIIKIIGLSMDTDIQKWEKYIKREQYPWTNIVIKQSFNNKFIKKLGVNTLPMNFLLNQDFKIIKQNTDIRKILIKIAENSFFK